MVMSCEAMPAEPNDPRCDRVRRNLRLVMLIVTLRHISPFPISPCTLRKSHLITKLPINPPFISDHGVLLTMNLIRKYYA
jgi:hypothetical protein